MKNLLVIALLFQCTFYIAQEEINSEVNYLNYDAFYESNALGVSPVLPNISSPYQPGYRLPWFSKKEKYKNNYFNVFPVLNVLGSYKMVKENTYSLNAGAGFGITTQLSDKFYARLILTGNAYQREGSDLDYSSIYRTDFLNTQDGAMTYGLQPRFRMSFTPYSFINIQAGIDQHFIGQGVRSMLLGDYTAPYPFVQLTTKIWKIEVTNIYQFFKEGPNEDLTRKFASTHFFNYKASDRFQIGVFESVVFAPKDTLLNRGYEAAYLNPFLFYRPTEYSLGSQDRLLIGLNTSYQFDRIMIYGQLAIDDFVLNELINRTRWWANKYSGQIGFKGKKELAKGQLRWQTELNFARPFMYSHLGLSTNYGNQGKPLAHPLSSNFVEVYSEASMHFNSNFTLTGRFFFVQQGGANSNDSVSYGADVYQPYDHYPYEYGFRIGGDGQVNRFNLSLEGSYRISEQLMIDAFIRPGIELNNSLGPNYDTHFMVFGGIRTSLWNDRSFTF
ncbi:hypothetical protein [Brumimicrobium aurantiacum]|uniref:Gliding motility protein RemB n=1 Tax=Brumimicrobium aurantiacum TaxID=1737063 RepID=A0A3E1EX56_9FLAO|nr:hypothetical protein [Brumimicrobium aurantiacum]RFC54098.1 hypothetical protein DXU93_08905 [Brumimicrobium aurantiacum]